MATAIRMPDFGTKVEQVELIRWLKQVGEPVKRGELLCEVETDKAVSRTGVGGRGDAVESCRAGRRRRRAGHRDRLRGRGGGDASVRAASRRPRFPPGRRRRRRPVAPRLQPRPATSMAAPMIRNLAKKEGVDLSRVTGTGPGGRITREDVLKAQGHARRAGGGPPAERRTSWRWLAAWPAASARSRRSPRSPDRHDERAAPAGGHGEEDRQKTELRRLFR